VRSINGGQTFRNRCVGYLSNRLASRRVEHIKGRRRRHPFPADVRRCPHARAAQNRSLILGQIHTGDCLDPLGQELKRSFVLGNHDVVGRVQKQRRR